MIVSWPAPIIMCMLLGATNSTVLVVTVPPSSLVVTARHDLAANCACMALISRLSASPPAGAGSAGATVGAGVEVGFGTSVGLGASVGLTCAGAAVGWQAERAPGSARSPEPPVWRI